MFECRLFVDSRKMLAYQCRVVVVIVVVFVVFFFPCSFTVCFQKLIYDHILYCCTRLITCLNNKQEAFYNNSQTLNSNLNLNPHTFWKNCKLTVTWLLGYLLISTIYRTFKKKSSQHHAILTL